MRERASLVSRLGGSWDGVKWVRIRAISLSVLLGLGLLVVFGRAIHLQVVQRDHLGTLARGQYIRTVELAPHRGEILDRGGGTLASSVEVESIFVDPSLLATGPLGLEEALVKVGQAAKLSAPKLRSLQERGAQPGNRFAWVRRKVSPTVAEEVRALGLPGIGFVQESRRFYPRKNFASQILGFVGADGHGLEGLERGLDSELRGQGARVPALRDAKGNALLAQTIVPLEERSGATVTLTLDRNIQAAAEASLSKAIAKAEALSGSAVVLDVDTGEILALASMPTFNPNVIPGKDGRRGVRNRAIADVFEPGSTLKAFLIAGALERGAIRTDQKFDCEKGRWRIGRHTIHDSHPYGLLLPGDILRVSSNVCSGKVALTLGGDGLEEIYRSFGFGARTGVDLPGEAPGLVGKIRGEIGLVTASFGQGPVMASSLQIAAAFAALANGGTLMKPWIVRSIAEPGGALSYQGAPEPARRVVSEQTASTVNRWLESVVSDDGTAAKAALDGYRIAGKTGTAQKVEAGTGRYGKGRLASFAGFAPADAPRIAIAVMIDEPTVGSSYGGQIAAPVFREIAEVSLSTLGIPASLPIARKGARVATAEARAASEGWIAVAPEQGEVGSPEQVVVPDVRGLFVRAALRQLEGAQLEPKLEGSGKVTSQRPAAGSVVGRGSSVTLGLEPM